MNLRNLQVYTGVSQTSAVAWVGKIYLSWDVGMNLTNPNYEFQVRRNVVQDIESENIWWASELVWSYTAQYLDSSPHATNTSLKIYNQSRMLGLERYHMGDLTASLSSGLWDGTAGVPNNYYYAIGLTDRESGLLVEFSNTPEQRDTGHFSSYIHSQNMGASAGHKVMIRRPSRRFSTTKSHVYWLGKTQSSSIFSYGEPIVHNCNIILERCAGGIMMDQADLYCGGVSASDQDYSCSSWSPNTCIPLNQLDGNHVCPSIAATAFTEANAAVIGCYDWCDYPNGDTCCIDCPPGEIIGIPGTIGEWRISRDVSNDNGFDYLGMDPTRTASEGGGMNDSVEYSRGWQGFSDSPYVKPTSWTSQGQGVYGQSPNNYAWYGADRSDEGISWSRSEAWVLGAMQSNQWRAWWVNNGIFDISEYGNGSTWEAFGHFAQIGSQRAAIIDMDYELFNWDPTNLSLNNPWYDKITGGLAPFEDCMTPSGCSTIDLDDMAFTHCGVIFTFSGEVLSAIGALDSFAWDDCYVRIRRYRGWDEHEIDATVPEDGWDVSASGIEVSTFRDEFNYGQVFDSRPNGDPVGHTIDTDGELVDETGLQISDMKSTWNSLNVASQPPNNSKWSLIIPAQPSGHWLYRVEIYEDESGDENKVWDSDYLLGLKYGANLIAGCGMCTVDEARIDYIIKRNWGPQDANSEFWRSIVTEEDDYWGDGAGPKYMWKDYNYHATDFDIPLFGDILPKFDEMYYMRGSNSVVIEGGAPISLGPSNTKFDLLFGQEHEHLMVEANAEASAPDALGYSTSEGEPVPGFAQSNSGLSNGDVNFAFDLCSVPEDGQYIIKLQVVCDDTGIVQWTEEIPIIVDHDAPLISEDGNFDELLDGDTLQFGFDATDNEGIAFMYAIPQSYNAVEAYKLSAPYLMCHQCYFLDSGDVVSPALTNTQTKSLECATELTALELSRCLCNGEFYMYAYTADYAGNCAVRRFVAQVSGAHRGMHPSGTCNGPHLSETLTLKPFVFFNSDVGGMDIYKEKDCCLDSGGTWNWDTEECDVWGTGLGIYSWDWQEGICLDCIDNPIDELTGAAALIHRDESLCVAVADPICTEITAHWENTANTTAEECNAIMQQGWMEVEWGHAMHQSNPDWGMAASLPMCPFLNYFGCCECEDETTKCECCSLGCVVDVEAGCDAGAGLDYNIIGPYLNYAGHPTITMLITDVDWNAGWNTNCGENADCQICFCIEKGCCNNEKSKMCHCGYVSFASGLLEGGCCNVCPIEDPIDGADVVLEVGKNIALYYTPNLQRWDAIDAAPDQITDEGDLISVPTVGGVALGKFGEQIVSIDDNLVGFTEKKSKKRRWLWHSKNLAMGNDASVKIFKKVKIRANLFFDYSLVASPVQNDITEFSTNSLVVLVDDKEVGLTLDFDIEDIPQIPSYDENSEKTFFTYSFKIDKKDQKGKTIAIRLQNQDSKSIVDSFNVIYRPKPIK